MKKLLVILLLFFVVSCDSKRTYERKITTAKKKNPDIHTAHAVQFPRDYSCFGGECGHQGFGSGLTKEEAEKNALKKCGTPTLLDNFFDIKETCVLMYLDGENVYWQKLPINYLCVEWLQSLDFKSTETRRLKISKVLEDRGYEKDYCKNEERDFQYLITKKIYQLEMKADDAERKARDAERKAKKAESEARDAEIKAEDAERRAKRKRRQAEDY